MVFKLGSMKPSQVHGFLLQLKWRKLQPTFIKTITPVNNVKRNQMTISIKIPKKFYCTRLNNAPAFVNSLFLKPISEEVHILFYFIFFTVKADALLSLRAMQRQQ